MSETLEPSSSGVQAHDDQATAFASQETHKNAGKNSTGKSSTAKLQLEVIKEQGVKLTPMMEQYLDIKQQNRDVILLFRMGDFYEVFFEDARLCSEVLNITLTHRGKLGEHPIPMAGIPHHAATNYVHRLTERGYRVAVGEQVEDPAQSKGIVKRAITKIVGPGIPFDIDQVDGRAPLYLCACFKSKITIQVVLLDFTTGEFWGRNCDNEQEVIEVLQKYSPREFLSFLGQWPEETPLGQYLKKSSVLVNYFSEDLFDHEISKEYIENLIPRYQFDSVLLKNQGFLAPIGVLGFYISSTQMITQLYHLRPFRIEADDHFLSIGHNTLTSLEIIPANSRDIEAKSKTLMGFIDKTLTPGGCRLLFQNLLKPLRNQSRIERRLDHVQSLIKDSDGLEATQTALKSSKDLARVLSKLSTRKISAQDLLGISTTVKSVSELSSQHQKLLNGILGSQWQEKTKLSELLKYADEIERTINPELGASLDKGNLILQGVSSKRDELSRIHETIEGKIQKLSDKWKEKLQISSLKIKSNNVLGFFVEVSKIHTSKVTDEFDRKQTLVGHERYGHKELEKLQIQLNQANDDLYRIECGIFDKLLSQLEKLNQPIINLTNSMAYLDFCQSLANVATLHSFTRPSLKKSNTFKAESMWHPVVKAHLDGPFTPHNIELNDENFFALITGPNMAGKTTVMREIAIIQVLTQIGSFVPAVSVQTGVRDYIFSRLGAGDDITKGQSTFMVEMSETSEIIRHATPESLVLLDELGRGTSTTDGLGLAWSIAEYFIEKIKCLTLFSTHYHELVDVIDGLEGAFNLSVKTAKKGKEVQFLYELERKGATHSYGLHVASLAGLPPSILNRSKKLIETIQSKDQFEILKTQQLNFFEHSFTFPDHPDNKALRDEATKDLPSSKHDNPESNQNQINILRKKLEELSAEIADIDTNNLTPVQALNWLDEFQSKVCKDETIIQYLDNTANESEKNELNQNSDSSQVH